MNEFILRNYFMIRGEHSAHSVLLRLKSTTHPFQTFYVPNAGLLELVHSILLVVCLDSSLTQTISPAC